MSKEKTVSEVGVIGQMYENRKSGKVGVLESREEKYKTLLMRETDGKTFNITYSTFRSDWRKYTGTEVVAETSTQKEEKKAEEKQNETKAKKTVKEKSTEPKMSTEERVKRLRALSDVVDSVIKEKGFVVKSERTSKGGIAVRYKRTKLFEIWDAFKVNKYSFRMKESFDAFVSTDMPREVLKDQGCNIRYRVDPDNFESGLNDMLAAADKFVQAKVEDEKKKTETNEEE